MNFYKEFNKNPYKVSCMLCSLFINKIKHKMYVKHIIIFTISVLLPNGLYSNDTTAKDKILDRQEYCMKMAENWTKTIEEYDPISTDYEKNVVIKLLVKPGAKRIGMFVIKYDRLGVNITANSVDEDEANKELLDYFANILGIPNSDLRFLFGKKLKYKTLEFTKKSPPIKDVIKKVVQKLVEEINFE